MGLAVNFDLFLFLQESLDELKLVVGDSFENVASLQDCHFQQRDSVQTLGKNLFCGSKCPKRHPDVS